MNDVDKVARSRMLGLVLAILIVVLGAGAAYLMLRTPGETPGQPSPHAINQDGQ